MHQYSDYIKYHVIIPAFSVSIAELATLPICTLKTNYQNTHSLSIIVTFKNMIKIADLNYNKNYFKVFYKASVPALFSQVFSTTTKLALYRKICEYSDNLMLNGATSGIIVSMVTHPFDTIKIRKQMRMDVLVKHETNIIKNLYKGYTQAFLKTVVGGMLYFPLYDYLKQYDLSPFISSASSAIISATLMHPFDYAKTRRCANLPWFVGYNPLNYLKGLHINLMRIVPHFTIVMTLNEYLRNKI